MLNSLTPKNILLLLIIGISLLSCSSSEASDSPDLDSKKTELMKNVMDCVFDEDTDCILSYITTADLESKMKAKGKSAEQIGKMKKEYENDLTYNFIENLEDIKKYLNTDNINQYKGQIDIRLKTEEDREFGYLVFPPSDQSEICPEEEVFLRIEILNVDNEFFVDGFFTHYQKPE